MGAQGNFVIRKAEKKDACLVLEFIRKIAEYERMSRQVVATRELLEEFVFDRKAAEVLIGGRRADRLALPFILRTFPPS